MSRVGRLRYQRTAGVFFSKENFTPDAVAAQFEKISDFDGEVTYPDSTQESMQPIIEAMAKL